MKSKFVNGTGLPGEVPPAFALWVEHLHGPLGPGFCYVVHSYEPPEYSVCFVNSLRPITAFQA